MEAEMFTWKSYSLGLRRYIPSRSDLKIKHHHVQNKLRYDHAMTLSLAFIYIPAQSKEGFEIITHLFLRLAS